ncbi:MAG: CPBP family intramembrane glutamic endopeptidase, partial [Cyanobacteria bacterium J06638_22]
AVGVICSLYRVSFFTLQRPFQTRSKNAGNPNFLLFGSFVLVALMIAFALVIGRMTGSLTALLVVCFTYWVGCWALCYFGSNLPQLIQSYRSPLSRDPIALLMTWLPPIGVFFAAFVSSLPVPSIPVLTATIGIAILNGVTEELFWRGAFVSVFSKQVAWGWAYPTVLFVLWHIALLCVPNVAYKAGALGMLGGAGVMGVLWACAFWRTRDLRSVTMAHVMTNSFAFTMLALENWAQGG